MYKCFWEIRSSGVKLPLRHMPCLDTLKERASLASVLWIEFAMLEMYGLTGPEGCFSPQKASVVALCAAQNSFAASDM